MKHLIIFVFFTFPMALYSQDWQYDINFEDSTQLYRIKIDTVSNPANIWQIGVPVKSVFNEAYSLPNAMVTDLSNPYPVNDTSVFYITHIANDGFVWPHTVIVAGYFKSDADSLNDFGLIEFSPDQGTTWINLINSPEYEQYIDWYTEKPVLTGLVPEWTYFYVNIAQLGPIFQIEWGDTLYYRFSFISDGVDNQRDGLMYDNLHFEDWWEIIDENAKNDFTSAAYPVPASSALTIEFENSHHLPFVLSLYDICGRQIYSGKNTLEDRFRVDIRDYPPGLCFYKLTNIETGEISQGNFIIGK